VRLLEKAGFEPLSDDATDESYLSTIKPNGKYYYTRNKSTLVAFTVGGKFDLSSGESGCAIIGGHTDSPNLRVKPRSKRSGAGCTQLGVECYGGGLWHTWFDRDLGLSGRVLVRNGGKIVQKLVKIDRALLRISNLAIHLLTADERKAFNVNKEDHLSPILAMEVKKALTGEKKDDGDDTAKDGWTEYQEPALLQLLATELDCDVVDIVDFELSLFDVQRAALGGVFSEFVHSARLDNLASCFMAVQALLDHVEEGNVEADKDVSMIVLYDHEEVGSSSAVGAASPILKEAVERISEALCEKSEDQTAALNVCKHRSLVLSLDQAHAVHPNYASKHEKNHQPKMNQGMVIKRNASQRYATTTLTGVLMGIYCHCCYAWHL
jgi:aspartyl aminopeptidase